MLSSKKFHEPGSLAQKEKEKEKLLTFRMYLLLKTNMNYDIRTNENIWSNIIKLHHGGESQW